MPRPPAWTPVEIKALRKHYGNEGWRKVHELTGRSKAAIQCKAKAMGISGQLGRIKKQWNSRFSPDQVRQIRENRHGWRQHQWAAHYGTTQGVISKIQNRISYPLVF